MYESKCEKNKENIKACEELEQIVKSQKISFEDFEKLKHSKTQLEKQLQTLNSKRQELNDFIWNTENNTNILLQKINEKFKQIKIISDKWLLDQDKDCHIDFNSLMNNFVNLDLPSVAQIFSQVGSNILSKISLINLEVKEKEDSLINLKSELLKLEDKISEANEFIMQKEAQHEHENNTLTLEKEKFSQLCAQRNEEIKKFSENLQKSITLISEKEKEIEEAKSKENYLESKYNDEEIETEKFIKELEKEYIETLKEVEKMKNENIMEIRKSQKGIYRIFETAKKELNNELN